MDQDRSHWLTVNKRRSHWLPHCIVHLLLAACFLLTALSLECYYTRRVCIGVYRGALLELGVHLELGSRGALRTRA